MVPEYGKRSLVVFVALALITGGSVLMPLLAQESGPSGTGTSTASSAPEDQDPAILERKIYRSCNNRDAIMNHKPEVGVEIGLDPDYRKFLENRIQNYQTTILGIVDDIKKKHTTISGFMPSVKNYQEVVMADNPGVWRDGHYVNEKKVIALTFNEQGDVTCIVMDSLERRLYNSGYFTRKVIRVYYPELKAIQLDTYVQNHYLPTVLDTEHPELIVRAYKEIRTLLKSVNYNMDKLIASHEYQKERFTDWQMNF